MDNIENYKWLFDLRGLSLIAYVGMFVHFLKKKIVGETIVEIKDYFKNHLKSTIIAIVATQASVCGLYFGLATGKTLDIVSALGCGLMCDSFFNKWDDK